MFGVESSNIKVERSFSDVGMNLDKSRDLAAFLLFHRILESTNIRAFKFLKNDD